MDSLFWNQRYALPHRISLSSFCFSLPFKSHVMRTLMGLLLLATTPSGCAHYYMYNRHVIYFAFLLACFVFMFVVVFLVFLFYIVITRITATSADV